MKTGFFRRVPALAVGAMLLAAPPALAAPQAVAGRPPGAPLPAALEAALARLIVHGGVAVGGQDGRQHRAYRSGVYVPASIVKLATALAAFHRLGPEFRFKTEFYRDGADNLIVRGFGDPMLISEEWALIARELAGRGALSAPFRHLIVDASAFARGLAVDGAGGSFNPYDARLGALVTNFNTVFVRVDAKGRVASAEPQTPLTPLALEFAKGLPPGEHRINFSRQSRDSLRYTGELAQAFLRAAGGRFRGRIVFGARPPGLRPILVHRSSRTLRDAVGAMMEYSNNFIANQLLLAMALAEGGEPATLARGAALVRGYLTDRLRLNAADFRLVEGSGISSRNRVRLGAMLRIVEAFRPWRELLRPYGKAPLKSLAKTGTLTGVYTLAGFLPGRPGRERAFVIMLNQPRNTRGAVHHAIAHHYGRRP